MRGVRRISYLLLGVIMAAAAGLVGVLWHQGYRAYIVHTGSMMPTYNPGGLVIDRPAPKGSATQILDSLHRGQVITFRHSDLTTDVVTHRITNVRDGAIHTKGDANPTADAWNIRPTQVRGTVTSYVPDLGYVVFFLKQRTGVAAVMTGALAIILLWELFFRTGGPKPATLVDPYRDEPATPLVPLVTAMSDPPTDVTISAINRLRQPATRRPQPV